MSSLFSVELFKKRYAVRFHWAFFLFFIFFFILFNCLGIWQLHRYHFKQEKLHLFLQHMQMPPKVLSSLQENQSEFQRVIIEGEYVPHATILVQNQVKEGQLGFEVLTPIRVGKESQQLLVDRGWVAALKDNLPPVIDEVKGQQRIEGYLKSYNEYAFILGDNITNLGHYPLVIQKVDIDALNHVLHTRYYSWVLKQIKDSNSVMDYERNVAMTMMPKRHLGYAIQWFLMAVVLLIAYGCFTVEKKKEK